MRLGWTCAAAAGDVEEAMELRCPDNRIDPEEHEQFEDEARRLTDALGPIRVGRIELDDPDPAVVASMARRHPTAWRYWLTVDGEEVDEPLVAVAADQGADREICTLTTTHYDRMYEELGDDLHSRRRTRSLTFSPIPWMGSTTRSLTRPSIPGRRSRVRPTRGCGSGRKTTATAA